MRLIYLSSLIVLLSACNEPGQDGQDGQDSAPCSVQDVDGGARITCPDGTDVLVENGSQGATGSQGSAGEDGQDCQATDMDGGVLVQCGEDELFLADGTDGENPPPCEVVPVDGGANVTCPDGSSSFLPDGEDVSTADEPPGANCAYGGTAFLVESDVVGYACDGRGFVDCDQPIVGDVIIESYLDIPKYDGCTEIQGNLHIRGVDTAIGLAGLITVGGELRIIDTNLTSLDAFSNLKTIGSDLIISQNPDLASLGGFQPDSVGDVEAFTNLFVILTDNPQLSSCEIDELMANMEINVHPNETLILNISDNLPCTPSDGGTPDAG